MNPDDPQPTRTFSSDPDSSPGLTRTFSSDPSSTASFSLSVPAPLTDPIPGWPAGLTRYQPLHPLGDGGMGVVYLCHDRQLDRQVAVKLSGLGRPTTQDRVEFVLREARSAARLHHPNICPVFDSDVCDGVPYLTMAYVDGPTLAAELKRNGPCPPAAAAKLVRTVAEAMQYAHDTGVIHRDLKPSNILLTADHEPIITDFGLAVRTDRDDAVGGISGTPHYMAPEQAAGDSANISERTDIFALGVILFQTLTGQVPFDGTAREVMTKVQREPLPPMRKFRKDVPKALERIVAKATARKPADRYPTMTAFADALTDFLQTTKPKAGRGWKWTFWLGAVPAMAVLGVSALCCGLGMLLPAIQKVRDAADRQKEERRDELVRELTREAEEYARRVDFKQSLAKCDEALKLDWQATAPRELRARLYDRQERTQDSLNDLDTLVGLDQRNADYRRWRAEVLMKVNRHREAVVDLTAIIDLKADPGTTVHTLRGEAYYVLKEYDKARADLVRAIELDKENANAWYLRSQVERELGSWEATPCGLEAWRLQKKLDERFRKKLLESPPQPIPPQTPGK